jgi:HEAT repeat protein
VPAASAKCLAVLLCLFSMWSVGATLRSHTDIKTTLLQQHGIATTPEGLTTALRHESELIRETAAELLGIMKVVSARNALRMATRDKVERVQLAAVGALVKLGDRSQLNIAHALARHRDLAIASRAAQVVCKANERVEARALYERLANDENWFVRQDAVALVGACWPSVDRRAALTVLMNDTAEQVRLAVVAAVYDSDDVSLVPILLRLLADESRQVRVAAHATLRSITDHNIPFDPMGSAAEREASIGRWADWCRKVSLCTGSSR